VSGNRPGLHLMRICRRIAIAKSALLFPALLFDFGICSSDLIYIGESTIDPL